MQQPRQRTQKTDLIKICSDQYMLVESMSMVAMYAPSLVPRPNFFVDPTENWAWYTLFAHALN